MFFCIIIILLSPSDKLKDAIVDSVKFIAATKAFNAAVALDKRCFVPNAVVLVQPSLITQNKQDVQVGITVIETESNYIFQDTMKESVIPSGTNVATNSDITPAYVPSDVSGTSSDWHLSNPFHDDCLKKDISSAKKTTGSSLLPPVVTMHIPQSSPSYIKTADVLLFPKDVPCKQAVVGSSHPPSESFQRIPYPGLDAFTKPRGDVFTIQHGRYQAKGNVALPNSSRHGCGTSTRMQRGYRVEKSVRRKIATSNTNMQLGTPCSFKPNWPLMSPMQKFATPAQRKLVHESNRFLYLYNLSYCLCSSILCHFLTCWESIFLSPSFHI